MGRKRKEEGRQIGLNVRATSLDELPAGATFHLGGGNDDDGQPFHLVASLWDRTIYMSRRGSPVIRVTLADLALAILDAG